MDFQQICRKKVPHDLPCMFMFSIFTRVRYVHRKYVSSFIRSSCLSFLSKSIFWCEVWLHTLSRKCVGIALDHASITLNSLSPDWVRACQCIQTSAALAQAVPPQPIIKATGLGKPEGDVDFRVMRGHPWLRPKLNGTATGGGKVGENAVEVDACKQYRSYCTEWLAGRVRWKNGIKTKTHTKTRISLGNIIVIGRRDRFVYRTLGRWIGPWVFWQPGFVECEPGGGLNVLEDRASQSSESIYDILSHLKTRPCVSQVGAVSSTSAGLARPFACTHSW